MTTFTHRELQIIKLICDCKSNPEIFKELGITRSGMEKAMNRMLKKTGMSNRLELGMFAIKHGMVRI